MSWITIGSDMDPTTAVLVEARNMRDAAMRQILTNAWHALVGFARRGLHALRLPQVVTR